MRSVEEREGDRTVKPGLNGHSKKTEIDFQDQLSLNAGQKYCSPREHSAILSTFIKLPFVYKALVLSNAEWPLKTGLTVLLTLTFVLHR